MQKSECVEEVTDRRLWSSSNVKVYTVFIMSWDTYNIGMLSHQQCNRLGDIALCWNKNTEGQISMNCANISVNITQWKPDAQWNEKQSAVHFSYFYMFTDGEGTSAPASRGGISLLSYMTEWQFVVHQQHPKITLITLCLNPIWLLSPALLTANNNNKRYLEYNYIVPKYIIYIYTTWPTRASLNLY